MCRLVARYNTLSSWKPWLLLIPPQSVTTFLCTFLKTLWSLRISHFVSLLSIHSISLHFWDHNACCLSCFLNTFPDVWLACAKSVFFFLFQLQNVFLVSILRCSFTFLSNLQVSITSRLVIYVDSKHVFYILGKNLANCLSKWWAILLMEKC